MSKDLKIKVIKKAFTLSLFTISRLIHHQSPYSPSVTMYMSPLFSTGDPSQLLKIARLGGGGAHPTKSIPDPSYFPPDNKIPCHFLVNFISLHISLQRPKFPFARKFPCKWKHCPKPNLLYYSSFIGRQFYS